MVRLPLGKTVAAGEYESPCSSCGFRKFLRFALETPQILGHLQERKDKRMKVKVKFTAEAWDLTAALKAHLSRCSLDSEAGN